MADLGQHNRKSHGIFTTPPQTSNYAFPANRSHGIVGSSVNIKLAPDKVITPGSQRGISGGAKLSRSTQVARFAQSSGSILDRESKTLGKAMGNYRPANQKDNIKGLKNIKAIGDMAVAKSAKGRLLSLPLSKLAMGIKKRTEATGNSGINSPWEKKNSKNVGNMIINGDRLPGRGIRNLELKYYE